MMFSETNPNLRHYEQSLAKCFWSSHDLNGIYMDTPLYDIFTTGEVVGHVNPDRNTPSIFFLLQRNTR